MSDTKEKKLLDLWTKNGYVSANKLWDILKKNGEHTAWTKREVVSTIADQDAAQLHHRPVKAKHSFITSASPKSMYVCDLLDMTPYARANQGVKWLLLCMDIFSRKSAHIIGMKNKTAPVAAEALERAFESLGGEPKVLLSDQGSEFKGQTRTMLARMGIIHRLVEVGDHNRLGVIDRFSGVVKRWIARHMTQQQTRSYIDELSGLIDNYNNAPHSTLKGMSPNEAWEYPSEARDIHYQRIKQAMSKRTDKGEKLQIGSWVRIMNLKKVFDKGYHVRYSLTPHKIIDIKGLNYFLDNGKFYRASRLLPIPTPKKKEDQASQDVAKEARQERRKEVILQSEGIEQGNVRRSLRERKPQSQLEDIEYGRVNW